MRFYEVSSVQQSTAYGTLAEATKVAKDIVKRGHDDWRNVSINEIEVPTDKANVLRLVNDQGGTHQYLRRWEFNSPRLGLALAPSED